MTSARLLQRYILLYPPSAAYCLYWDTYSQLTAHNLLEIRSGGDKVWTFWTTCSWEHFSFNYGGYCDKVSGPSLHGRVLSSFALYSLYVSCTLWRRMLTSRAISTFTMHSFILWHHAYTHRHYKAWSDFQQLSHQQQQSKCYIGSRRFRKNCHSNFTHRFFTLSLTLTASRTKWAYCLLSQRLGWNGWGFFHKCLPHPAPYIFRRKKKLFICTFIKTDDTGVENSMKIYILSDAGSMSIEYVSAERQCSKISLKCQNKQTNAVGIYGRWLTWNLSVSSINKLSR